MTYTFNIILCVSIMCFVIFFAISFTEVIKHVKLIISENHNECKTKHLFLRKNVVTRFDKKMTTWRKKSIDEEKNLLLRTLKKKILSMRTLRRIKKTLITVKPKDSAINEIFRSFRATLFGFLVMVYDRVDDGDKFSRKILVLQGSVFILLVT